MYNTRRTGAASAGSGGRAASATQVNYHQQPGRGGATNTPQSRNPGYSTQQTPYNSAAQPAYQTQPAYTTPAPQAKPAPPQPPVAAQPPLPAAAKQPATPQPTALPLKQEPLTPVDTPKAESTENGTGTATKQPFWKKRPFVKVSNRVRKARQNAKLRRVLNPKNALTFLNELRPGAVKFNVREEPGWGYVATVDIDGKTFSGNALTVNKAKVQASEQALKHLLLEQLSKSQSAAPPSDKEENKDKSSAKPDEDEAMQTDSEDGAEPKSKKIKVEYPEDELPWGSLAAFALHKLFAEWQSGPEIVQPPTDKQYDEEMGEEAYFTRRPGPPPPEFGFPRRFGPGPAPFGRGRGFAPYPPRGPPPPGFGMRRPPPIAASFLPGSRPALPLGGPSPAAILPMKKIPEDANKRHPVMLLNQLKPNVVYNETKEGEAPNVFFNITIDIDGKQYYGRGKSKKEAKKNAAKAALVPLGIQYDE